MTEMNEQLNNILKHYNIPLEQRGPLADDVFGVFLEAYKQDTFPEWSYEMEKLLIADGFLREDFGA